MINKISTRSLAFLIFAIGWIVCGRPQSGHESMMPLLSFSLLPGKCLIGKNFPVSGNILINRFATLFAHTQPFHQTFIFSGNW